MRNRSLNGSALLDGPRNGKNYASEQRPVLARAVAWQLRLAAQVRGVVFGGT
jgi:hypothetical protein